MMKLWLAPGRVLVSIHANAICQCHLSLLCLFKESAKLLNFDWLSVFALLILVHLGSRDVLKNQKG